jgi:hypothetical protein
MSSTERSEGAGEHLVPSSEADALQRDIERRQAQLAATVDELTTRVHPRTVLRTGQDSLRRRARGAVVAEDGQLRVERVVAVVSAAVALVGAMLWRSGRRRRHRRG